MSWIDISVPLDSSLPVWPGDPDVEVTRVHDMAEGAGANLSTLSMCLHNGTHVDAPLHFIKDGRSIDEIPLDVLCGPCRVVDCGEADRITADLVASWGLSPGDRVLIKTSNSRLWGQSTFCEEAVGFDPGGAVAIRDAGVTLLGIDYLSVASYGGQGLKVHHVLLGAGIPLIESINLSGVEPGPYELVCAPLRVVGVEAAPARVLIRRLPG